MTRDPVGSRRSGWTAQGPPAAALGLGIEIEFVGSVGGDESWQAAPTRGDKVSTEERTIRCSRSQSRANPSSTIGRSCSSARSRRKLTQGLALPGPGYPPAQPSQHLHVHGDRAAGLAQRRAASAAGRPATFLGRLSRPPRCASPTNRPHTETFSSDHEGFRRGRRGPGPACGCGHAPTTARPESSSADPTPLGAPSGACLLPE